MASNSKISLIIEKLLEKTNSAEVKWSSSGQSNGYIARLDDYAFHLPWPGNTMRACTANIANVVLEILRSDGTRVARVSTGQSSVNALYPSHAEETILPAHQATSLRKLFRIVSSGDSELDAILKSLR